MFAFCLLLRDWPSFAFVVGPLSILYWVQVRFEEARLARLFPNDWPAYARQVPRIVPRRWVAAASTGWSLIEWRRNREYNALVMSLVALLAIYVWQCLSPLIWQARG